MTPMTHPGAHLGAVLRDQHAMLQLALRSATARLDGTNRRIADYHLGFVDAAGQPVAAGGGKMIRGTLSMLSALAVGGATEAGVRAAVAVELTHSYSLLHDDIIDRDETRRHRPAAWTVFGSSAALLAGDAMASLAVEVLADPGDAAAARGVRSLAAAARRMVAGQSADIAFESAGEIGLAECEQMVADKTGALLACAAALGAIVADGPADVAGALADFGAHLGMAFQLIDDLLGIWGTTERTGKPVASDLASRKKSLPVVAALAAGGPDSDRLRALYAHDQPLTVEELAAAAHAVEAAGGRRWAEDRAAAESRAALESLAAAPIDAAVRRRLTELTEELCRRDH